MIVELYTPRALSPSRLDRLLASGWFRARDYLFRSEVICLDGDVSSVINIRTRLDGYQMSKSLRRLLRTNNELFRVEVGPMSLDAEKERLYQLCKPRFKGMIVRELSDFFVGESRPYTFNTRQLCVYAGDRLVAVSFFDTGKNAIASLLGLYDPEWKNHSLGLYTLALELELAISERRRFFYPGYIIDGATTFDYKLRLGNLQYYSWDTNRWYDYKRVSRELFLGQNIRERLLAVQQHLDQYRVPYRKMLYPLFSLSYLGFFAMLPYVKSPVFLACYPENHQGGYLTLSYDPDEGRYILGVTQEEYFDGVDDVDVSEEFMGEGSTQKLLRYEEIIFAHENPQKVARWAADFRRRGHPLFNFIHGK